MIDALMIDALMIDALMIDALMIDALMRRARRDSAWQAPTGSMDHAWVFRFGPADHGADSGGPSGGAFV